jgi:translation initiation factor IF-3
LKEIKLSPNIGAHDVEYRVKQANKFLESGHQVKVTLTFKGREKAHADIGRTTMTHFVNECTSGTLASAPKEVQGRRMFITATLNPKGNKQK